MSNNLFFKSFFKNNDPIWNQIQNNPLVRRDLFPNYVQKRLSWSLVDANGALYPYDINELVQFYPDRVGQPNEVAPKRVRVHRDHKTFTKRIRPYRLPKYFNDNLARDYIKKYDSELPAPATVLPDPLQWGITVDQRRYRSWDNAEALEAINRFKLNKKHFTNSYYYTKSDDYWLPDYQGRWEDLLEKGSKRQPHSINKDMKFLGNKPFLSPKQKEAMIWMFANLS